MTKDDMEIVSALQLALADKVGSDRYELWFGAQTQLSVAGDTLEVRVATPFYQDWLRRHFRAVIEQTSSELLGRPIHVAFSVDASIGETRRAARSAPRGATTTKPVATKPAPPKGTGRSATHREDSSDGQLALNFSDASRSLDLPVGQASADEAECAVVAEIDSVASPELSVSGSTVRPAQGLQLVVGSETGLLPASEASLPAARRPLHTLESFVVGSTNRMAHVSACGVAQRPGSATPLLLHGPTGVGKTHLLEGIVSRSRRTFPQLRTLMLTAEQFTSYFMAALHGSGLPSFRMKYRGVGLLAIDGIQFFAGKKATVIELLHTIDSLLREGKQVVLSADRPAEQLNELGMELVARLQGGLNCPIESSDYETRRAVVAQQAAQMGMEVPEEVCALLASQITTHARALTGALRRLALASHALEREINVALAEEALADLLTAPVRQLRLSDIEAATCDVFSLDPNSLQSTERGKRVDCPRMLAMWLARKHTRAALSEIGQYFGKRTHSTVISASKKIDACLTQSAGQFGGMRIDELVRRVEQRLGTA